MFSVGGLLDGTRQAEYPLLECGWDREQCERYLARIVGETWRKSACTFCPFSRGKRDVLIRYQEAPGEAADALFLEYVAMTFNPAMTLFSGRSLRSVLEADGNHAALCLLEERLNDCPWAHYRVRRIIWAKGRADRKTERLSEGNRAQVVAKLRRQGATDDSGIMRLYLRRREEKFPTLEEMLVAAPAVVVDKCRPSFDGNWNRLAGGTMFDLL